MNLKTGKTQWSYQLYELYREDPRTFSPSLETFWQKIPQDEHAKIERFLEEGLQDGQSKHFVHKHYRGDGSIAYIDMVGQAVFDSQGEPEKLMGVSMDVSHLIEVQKHNQELAHILQTVHQEVYIVDYETLDYLYANDMALTSLGYSLDELLTLNVKTVNPYLNDNAIEQLKLASESDSQVRIENESIHRRKDGSEYPVFAILQLIEYKGKKAVAIFDQDMTDIKAVQNETARQFSLLENILNHVPVRIFWKDRAGRYLGGNQRLLEDAGLTSLDELIGKTDFELPWGYKNAVRYQTIDQEVMRTGKQNLQYEDYISSKNGETTVLSVSTVPLRDEHNSIIGVLGSYEDVTQLQRLESTVREQEESLFYQANHDQLTGLPNRHLLLDRVEHALDKATVTQQSIALLLIDLDQFKKLNDSLGHQHGDELLKQFALRLKRFFGYQETVSRIGGDEFAILAESIENVKDATRVAQSLINLAKEPFAIQGEDYYLSASIGLSLFPKDGLSPTDLLRSADAALYRAKDEGRDNFQFFTEDMTRLAFEHLALQSSLRQGLKNDEFEVFFQPQVNAKTLQLQGMEVLIRWNHPTMGRVSPGRFIPVAEESGMIVELDRMVMRKAVEQWVIWHRAGLNPGVLSLNLAVKNLQESNFVNFVADLLKELHCPPQWIEFEVTESDIMRDLEQMFVLLNKLKAMGIQVAIDDFGTGYSSLAYLKRLPVSKLKIDQSFIRDLPHDEEDSVITKTVIAMAQNLGLKVLAEGVETSEQNQFLVEHGCYLIQGYYYSRPEDITTCEAFLNSCTGFENFYEGCRHLATEPIIQ